MSIEPTLAEVLYFRTHGVLPSSLKEARAKAQAETIDETITDAVTDFSDDETEDTGKPVETETPVVSEWPKKTAGDWWVMSNGKKYRNEKKARTEQAKLI